MIWWLIRFVVLAFTAWGIVDAQGASSRLDGGATPAQGGIGAPVFADAARVIVDEPAANTLVSLTLWSGETPEERAYYGQNGAIRGGLNQGGGHASDWCFVGTPPADGVASFRVSNEPPLLTLPYLSCWMKATAPGTVWVSFLYFDERARLSNEVPVEVGTEWTQMQLPVSNWMNASWDGPRIQTLQVRTGRVGVDVYVDDLVNLVPVIETTPEPHPEPEPEPEPEPTPGPGGAPTRYRVTITADVVIEEVE